MRLWKNYAINNIKFLIIQHTYFWRQCTYIFIYVNKIMFSFWMSFIYFLIQYTIENEMRNVSKRHKHDQRAENIQEQSNCIQTLCWNSKTINKLTWSNDNKFSELKFFKDRRFKEETIEYIVCIYHRVQRKLERNYIGCILFQKQNNLLINTRIGRNL